MSNTDKKVGLTVRVENMFSGLTADSAPSVAQLKVAGITYSKAQILAKLQAILALYTAAANAKAASKAATAARKAQGSTNMAFVGNLRSALLQALGNDPAALASMGIVVKPRAKRTATAIAIAKAKASATRLARGTMGKKQRAQKQAPQLVVLGQDGQPLGSSASPAAVAAPTPTPSKP